MDRRLAAMPLGLGLLALSAACAHGPSKKEKENAEIHYNLGTEALRNGRPQEALKEYDEALKVDEGFADAHMGRGLVLEAAFGRTDEAEREYRRALELRPSYSEAHNDLGQLLARTGRLEEALKEFDASLQNMLYKEPWVARCNKGQALWRMGRRDEGLSEFRTCLNQAPRFCQGHRELGRLWLADGKTREAIEEFTQYARSCERTPDAWYQLGLSYLRAGDAEKAREALDKCLGLGAEGSLAEDCRRAREPLR